MKNQMFGNLKEQSRLLYVRKDIHALIVLLNLSNISYNPDDCKIFGNLNEW